MKTILALFVLLTAHSAARVGESVAELKVRYGRPMDAEGAKDAKVGRYTFQHQLYVITVTVREGRSVSEELNRRDRRDFTLEEVRTLLEDEAAPGAAWNQVGAKTWRQRGLTATWLQRTLLVQGE